MNKYKEDFKVYVFQTAANGKLSVKGLFDFLNETAANHCIEEKITVKDLNEIGLTWMLSRMHIEIKRMPESGEKISVITWPTGAKGLFSLRDFIVTAEDGEEIVTATRAWLTINLEKRRVVRLPDSIIKVQEKFAGEGKSLHDDFKDKLNAPGEQASTSEIHRATYSTLDINYHVTAPVYVNWMLDSIISELPENAEISSLELNYKQEILPGGSAVARHEITEKDRRLCIDHSICDAAAGAVNAIARSCWKTQAD